MRNGLLLTACAVGLAACADGGNTGSLPLDAAFRPDTGTADAGPIVDAAPADATLDATLPDTAVTPPDAAADAAVLPPDAAVLPPDAAVVVPDVGPTPDAGPIPDAAPPTPSTLVIAEVDYDQSGADSAEYIELYNTADTPTPLAGLHLELVNGGTGETYGDYDLAAAGAELGPHAYLVIGAASVVAALPPGTVSLPLDGLIQNGPRDGARVMDTSVNPPLMVDGIAWEGALDGTGEGRGAPGDSGDGALGRCPIGVDTNDNLTDFVVVASTPGADHVCPPPAPHELTLTVPPEVPAWSGFAVTVGADSPAGMTGVALTFDFAPAAGARGPDAATILAGEQQAVVGYRAGPTPGMVHLIVRAPDLDLRAEADFAVVAPLPIVRVPLVINEVDVDQPGADSAEFIELHNATAEDAPLTGLQLALYNAAATEYATYPLDGAGDVLAAGGYLVLGSANVLADLADLPAPVPTIELTGSIQNAVGGFARIEDVLMGGRDVLESVALGGDPGNNGEGPGMRIVDGGADAAYTLDRCPDGTDTQSNSADFGFGTPTPGLPNACLPALNALLNPARVLVNAAFSIDIELAYPAPVGGLPVVVALAAPTGACAADAVVAEGTRHTTVDCTAPDAAGDYDLQVTVGVDVVATTLSVGVPPPQRVHLLINEVDYDQPGADLFDFIEIVNPTDAPTPLTGVVLQTINGDGSIATEYDLGVMGDSLAAGGIVVYGMDAVLAALPVGIHGEPLDPLQNGPDAVRLIDTENGGTTFIDGLAYEGPIPVAGEGPPPVLADEAGDAIFALARCPVNADTNDNNADFRLAVPSPGLANTCPAPLNARVVPAAVSPGEAFTLTFDQPLPAAAPVEIAVLAAPVDGVTCPPTATIAAGDRTVTVDCTAGMVPGDVVLSGTDADGAAQATVTVLPPPPVRTGIVINEFDYDQPNGDGAEFIELKNTSAGVLPLAGLELELVDGSTNTVYQTVSLENAAADLQPGEYLVAGVNAVTAALPMGAKWVRLAAGFQNGPDGLRLVDTAAGMTLDGVAYGQPLAGTGEGDPTVVDNGAAFALSRCPDGQDTDDNRRDFSLIATTPGAVNACP